MRSHLGSFAGGKVWIEDEQGTSLDEVVMKNKIHQLRGSWLDMHDNSVSFDARRFHKVEPHVGHSGPLRHTLPLLSVFVADGLQRSQ